MDFNKLELKTVSNNYFVRIKKVLNLLLKLV